MSAPVASQQENEPSKTPAPRLHVRLLNHSGDPSTVIKFEGIDITRYCTAVTIVGRACEMTHVQLDLIVAADVDVETENVLTQLKDLREQRGKRLQSSLDANRGAAPRST